MIDPSRYKLLSYGFRDFTCPWKYATPQSINLRAIFQAFQLRYLLGQDGLHIVHWTVYSLGSTEAGLPSKHIPSTLYHENTIADPNNALVLIDLVHLARSQGHYVVENENLSGIWVFDLCGAGASITQKADFATLANRNALSRITSGHLRATDLTRKLESPITEATYTRSSAVTQSPSSTSQDFNIEAFARNNSAFNVNTTDSNAVYEAKPDDVFQRIIDIHSKFITAIKKSLEYHLTLCRNYVPMGHCLLVRTNHDIDILEGDSGAGMSFPNSEVLYYLHVQWKVSGVLTMFCHTPSAFRLQSILDAILIDSTGATEVRLSPSGKQGVYCGMETSNVSSPFVEKPTTKDGQHVQTMRYISSSENWKSSIVAHLVNRGFKVSLQDTWIRVRIGLLSNNKCANDLSYDIPTQEVIILWPAKLCFRHLGGHTYEHSDLQMPDDFARWISDPLTTAETWIMGKAERAERTESKLQEDLTSIARLREKQEAEDEDDMSNAYYRTNQYVEAQDVNGIYPTPPDVFQCQQPEPQPTQDVQISPSSNRDIDCDKFDSVSQRQLLLTTATDLDKQPNNLQFDNEEDDDLFGDMDTEMFASNGLTDADFSFFDDPTFDMIDEVVDQMRVEDLPKSITPNIPPPSAVAIATHELPKSTDITQIVSIEASPSKIQGLMPQDASLDICVDMSPPTENVGHVPTQTNSQSTTLAVNTSSSVRLGQLDQHKQMSDSTGVGLVRHYSRTRSDGVIKGRKSSVFDTITFGSDLYSDEKYMDTGRFGFDADSIPMHIQRKENPGQAVLDNLLPRLNPHFTLNQAGPSGDGSVLDAGLLDGSSDSFGADSFAEPECMDDECSPDALFIPGTPQSQLLDSSEEASKKRKRRLDCETDDSDGSTDFGGIITSTDTQMLSVAKTYLLTSFAEIDESSAYDQQPTFTHDSKYTNLEVYTGNDQTFIEVAQVLADQLASHLSISNNGRVYFFNSEPPVAVNLWDDPLSVVVLDIFPSAVRCNIKSYANIGNEGTGNANANLRSAARRQGLVSHQANALSIPLIINLSPPRLTVLRADTALEVFPSAVQFWEELGLNPCHGGKDINAYAMYPAGDAIQRGVETFMDLIQSTYQRSGLGVHSEGSGLLGYPNGHVSVSIPNGDTWQMMENIESACTQLGTRLSGKIAPDMNVVIYLVNPFSDPKMLPYLCAAFLQILKACSSSVEALPHKPWANITLQMIPLDLVTRADTISIPSPTIYTRIAFTVYDRVQKNSLSSQEGSGYHSTASIQLAKPLPKGVNFRLTPEPPISLMDMDRSIHVSYAWSDGNSWLTAAFTDKQGSLQWKASYYARDDDKQSLSNIFQEIVAIAAEIIKPDTQWWLYIAKVGRMQKKEVEAFGNLTTMNTWPQVILTLIEVDTNPLLRVLGPDWNRQRSDLTWSTSDNQHSPAPPAMGYDHDANARLVEGADDSWGVITVNDPSKPVIADEGCSPLVTGYLVKRLGPRDEDGFTTMQVNILHGHRPHDVLLRELLETYRSLGTLAKVRGVTDPITSVLPWHVAVAQKANAGLNALMRYDPG